MVKLRYDVDSAPGVNPIKQMEKLGYKIIEAIPQTIAGQWWFTVEELVEPLPPYLEVMEYDFEKWHEEV